MGLITHYKLDKDGIDSTGNSPTLSISGENWTTGIYNDCIDFDRYQSAGYARTESGITIPSTSSISIWAKHDTVVNMNMMIFCLNSDSFAGPDLYCTNGNVLHWNTGDSALNSFEIDLPTYGKWHHYVVVDTGSAIKLYIDGGYVADAAMYRSMAQTNKGFTVGNYIPGSDGYTWQGSLDDAMIFDTALNAEEIKEIYNKYKLPKFKLNTDIYHQFTDGSRNNYMVSNSNVESGHGKNSKYSAYFNGELDTYLRADIEYIPSQDENFSWGGWFMKNKHSVSSYPIFASFSLPYIACNSSISPFRISYNDGGQKDLTGTTIPELNKWYHVMAIRRGSTLEIYVNGILEGSKSISSCSFGDSKFDIGRHYNTDDYRIWGRADDVRFYNYAISQEELNVLANKELDRVKLSIRNNGDIIIKNLQEDVDWELLNNWICPSKDESITQFDDCIDSKALTSIESMEADGWTTYLTTVDSDSYTKIKGYSQQFYSDNPIGYIEKQLPDGYDMVRVKWGNWYTGTARVKIDGAVVQDLTSEEGGEFYTAEYSGTPKIRIGETGIYWIGEIWVGKKKQNTSINSNIIRNKLSKNLHKYKSSWTPGMGSVGDFTSNGEAFENVRKYGGDPWGRQTVVWNCYPEAVSGPDGGWSHNEIPIDNTKMYRYSVWVRRNNVNNGTFYHGCNGYGSTDGVYYRSSDSFTTNPYFYNSSTGIPVNQWVLCVGHIWPHNAGIGSVHEDSGVYNLEGDKILDVNDFRWHPTTTTGRGRNYLYYSTDTNQRQRMVYPIFEVCDGTETSVVDLKLGKAYNNIGYIPENTIDLNDVNFKISDNGIITDGDIIIK